jgi:glycosidase
VEFLDIIYEGDSSRAWTWDAATQQYYDHAYLAAQPDLNWRHAAVQDAMLAVLSFWLERGVDGFRVDALRQLMKDEQLRDNPPSCICPATSISSRPHGRRGRPGAGDLVNPS